MIFRVVLYIGNRQEVDFVNSVKQDRYVLALHNTITSGDKWGITFCPDNVTNSE